MTRAALDQVELYSPPRPPREPVPAVQAFFYAPALIQSAVAQALLPIRQFFTQVERVPPGPL